MALPSAIQLMPNLIHVLLVQAQSKPFMLSTMIFARS